MWSAALSPLSSTYGERWLQRRPSTVPSPHNREAASVGLVVPLTGGLAMVLLGSATAEACLLPYLFSNLMDLQACLFHWWLAARVLC
ncbi:uncharacterized protein [Triticum aestivum]|uniref:uncharacterized protein isoform X2 n=1 Tax=Triticum aestivum TaxID=4565 RepID=UPI001D027A78|nr:uncharacterized protein LOC123058642 isoform X2 [Triticum aestivum]